MNALERAERDIQQGDHWLARQRLTSYLATKGYDSAILEKLGQISWDMHDKYNAGCFWFTSDTEGEEVDEAISMFLNHAGSDAQQVVGNLPNFVRVRKLEDYPVVVQESLKQHGLEEAFLKPKREPIDYSKLSGVRAKLAGLVLLGMFLGFIGSCGVGCVTMFGWMFGEE